VPPFGRLRRLGTGTLILANFERSMAQPQQL